MLGSLTDNPAVTSCKPGVWANWFTSNLVWRTKYRTDGEHTICDSLRRVSRAAASAEADGGRWEETFFDLMSNCRFLPGGRILAGAGVTGASTLLNCFVSEAPGDSPDAMWRSLNSSMLTLASGGGVGIDFSALSPSGRPTDFGAVSAGPVACIDLWETTCDKFLAGAARRGAMMASLRCDHPDVEAFIDAKRTVGSLPRFNLSVQVTDAFIAAVKAGQDWPLSHGGRTFKIVIARDLWTRLAQAAYDVGEPGILFVDNIARENNLWWRERVSVTNPCGEVPLPPHGACCLGSLNLMAFVRNPFAPEAALDLRALAEAAAVAVRFLDNVIDLTSYPLPEQRDEAGRTRRIGLGVTGLADMLIMLGAVYGDQRSLDIACDAMKVIRDSAYRASIGLAKVKGAFPAFESQPFLQGAFSRRLPADIRCAIAGHGLRNSHLLAIAPTGSISLLAGSVSTGIEPVYAAIQIRAVTNEYGETAKVELIDPALARWRAGATTPADAPPAFIEAHQVSPAAQLAMQAALQPYVDQAISKTLNVRRDLSFDDFRDALDLACGLGIKGLAAYRPNPVREPVLSGRDELSCRPSSSCA